MKQYKLYTTVGIIETDDYWDKDKYVLHREDGPAYINYNYDHDRCPAYRILLLLK